jgi:S-formylglutathione hydrolase FrmB
MLTDELIPLCQRKKLGTGKRRIGLLGISMGGYGALLVAEKHPHLVGAAAAISPAIWTSYAQAKAANRGAYATAADFAANDAVTHASALEHVPVRIASGYGDPFYPGVQIMARALPRNPGGTPAELYFGNGCHTGPFFKAQEPPSLAFLARHLTGRG